MEKAKQVAGHLTLPIAETFWKGDVENDVILIDLHDWRLDGTGTR
jgi:hypothetical protein